ncbi:hypothetical protein Anacy_3062 [Anabaena cylindrica PCC 7122]|uniref:Uncharacterized protein n=1 Tax=Anabaena cylindrica (strain ATCC 27899 / PCC 7122) TaxID=272123 RepID=K9ZGW4_ANACC|nr:hypothetical protein Anacy_3062 [Anabaena cylindrica PCC 7122]BAY04526.1 hypothetical protein NIES19_37910 [Anabaena cylindrica PCC 7122]
MEKLTQVQNKQSNLSNLLYQMHSENTSMMTKVHHDYLQVQQKSLQEINSMQINLADYQKFVKQLWQFSSS